MDQPYKLAKKWLILAVSALAGAGVYSLPPVIFRGPFFQNILPVEAIFASSLVIHVDLSVLVWMLAIGGLFWSNFYNKKYDIFYKYAFYSAALGTSLIAFSPFTGNLNPLKNNYIPVLQNPLFFIGLGLFTSGILLQAILTVFVYNLRKKKHQKKTFLVQDNYCFGLYIAAIITLIAFICFTIAGVKSPVFDHSNPTLFYENIFWGGGHLLQASYSTLLVIAWFVLLESNGYKNPLSRRTIYILFCINLLTSLPAPLFYLSEDNYSLFATHMRDFLGVAPFISAISIGYALLTNKQKKTTVKPITLTFLILSILLFGYGGILAYMIKDVNVTIPAHYHGSIVGITLAFMGIVYYYMPKVGFRTPSGVMAKCQPYIYGIGQAMHITGLAVMGGYGALRKQAASSQNIDTIFGKALFFSGGSFAIFGGLVFVVVVYMAMRKN